MLSLDTSKDAECASRYCQFLSWQVMCTVCKESGHMSYAHGIVNMFESESSSCKAYTIPMPRVLRNLTSMFLFGAA